MKTSQRLFDFLFAVRYDLERKYWAQYFPRKPRVINLLVNDICNSHCSMCMIWKRKREHEVTPQELLRILSDPLFVKVRRVGVSGGEPTLRADLPQLYKAVCQALPNLQSVSIITNAIKPNQVIERIQHSVDVCRGYQVKFGVMVSLDGVGEIHDLQRGRKGNFDTALQVIRYFRDRTDIPISVGCTITKQNLWAVDELLEFCQNEGIQAHFRVAEFIDRLYNENEKDVIRNFTPVEAYHLALFFMKLDLQYERRPEVRRTYRSIQKMLVGEADRTIGCPYQSRAVVLDACGQMQYCAPKSLIIGNALEESAKEIYKRKLAERRRILAHDCRNCIHDYHSDPTVGELINRLVYHFWRRVLSLDYFGRVVRLD
jgi:MoaA/NifB/PqqE/SkfB family radical SAM enzyme